jgi:hypothetical protein
MDVPELSEGAVPMAESSAVASEVVSAVTSVSETVGAVANAPETISNLFEMAGKAIYGAGYTAAFIVVFPAAFIFAAVPKGNALVQGILDGSAAARNRAEGMLG